MDYTTKNSMPDETAKKRIVMLIAFYNIKALGVRYLEAALRRSGYSVVTVFFKDFSSTSPEPVSELEQRLLGDIVDSEKPFMIGFSVASSMYLDTVNKAIVAVRSRTDVPTVCGGAFATMFPGYFLDMGISFVIRTDGEISLCQLADALSGRRDWRHIPSLCYKADGEIVMNSIGNILTDIDGYGLPSIECERAYFIEKGKVRAGDPQLGTMSYEAIASRGCPFTCSYCCSSNLRRLFPQGTKYVRARSVESVINELVIVKRKFKKLIFIHFYDEIFPDTPGWVDEFAAEYKKHIRLPFTIWSHPKKISGSELKKLVSAGLVEVIMGIQSGSESLRRSIFRRFETQQDIIDAARIIHESGVNWASYDFMLQHPFESVEDLKETYFLIEKLFPPFELQLHGLNFLPGADIADMAVKQGILTSGQMDAIMYAPMQKQFDTYWSRENKPLNRLWYRMIYCLQFPGTRKKIERYADDPAVHEAEIGDCYESCRKMHKIRHYRKKINVVLRRIRLLLALFVMLLIQRVSETLLR